MLPPVALALIAACETYADAFHADNNARSASALTIIVDAARHRPLQLLTAVRYALPRWRTTQARRVATAAALMIAESALIDAAVAFLNAAAT